MEGIGIVKKGAAGLQEASMAKSQKIGQTTKKSPVVWLRRKPPTVDTRLTLWVKAGGRCEFDACNRYLLEHHVTKAQGNFSQIAHIVAYQHKGPRGRSNLTAAERNDLSNLMLLCPTCHKHIDDDPKTYLVELLKQYKRAHEDRVFMLTDTKPDRRTVGLILKANIGASHVDIPFPQMQDAVAPRYLDERELCEIDLTNAPEFGTSGYWDYTTQTIREKTRRFYERNLSSEPIWHVSIFALGPIPLLVYLGACLSNKIPTSLFQRHRDTENWKWKEKGDVVSYQVDMRQRGSDPSCVALILSLSGRIPKTDFPESIDERFSLCEITLAGREPSPRFLELEEDLRAFRDCYLQTMRMLVAEHEQLKSIHLFPAVPAPVAVAVGLDLMPKRDPHLIVYDYQKDARKFVRKVEVNPSETQRISSKDS